MEQLHLLAEQGHKILPIMSKTASETDTRFGRASDFIWELEDTCHHKVIKTIAEAEPIGPKHLVDLMVVAPCTGNTLAKLSWGITDTPVTMAVKSSLRIGLPVVLALATNDALAASAQNLGRLLNVKNLYFVPCGRIIRRKSPLPGMRLLPADSRLRSGSPGKTAAAGSARLSLDATRGKADSEK